MNVDLRRPKLDFRIQNMAVIYDASQGTPAELHRHDYYTVLLVNKARGEHIIDSISYPFGSSELHFISPGQIHQVKLKDRPEGRAITFSTDFLAVNNISESFISNINLFNEFGESPPLDVSSKLLIRLNAIVDEMESCQLEDLSYRKRALGALLQLFLIYANQESRFDLKVLDQEGSGACILRDFKELINEHFKEEHQVSAYAKMMNISRKHLHQTIHQITGKGPKEHIKSRVLLEAKRLLIYSDISVKEIAYQLGFKEPEHLSHFFKKYLDLSPSAYRQKMSQ